jgi:predicted ATPase/DNA-binding XRE family transcriptional regulator/Tfp pilus assembly protein PilF
LREIPGPGALVAKKFGPKEGDSTHVDTASGLTTLADLVRHYRSVARLSQEEMAERAGLSARTVSDIECGVARSPRAVTLSLLAEALALDPPAKQRLYASVRRGPASPEPALVSPQPKLPAGPARLIGRADELRAARTRILEEPVPLLNVTGAAGVGKTAFVLGLARDLAESFERVLYVDLAGLPDAGFVLAKIAVDAGFKEVPGVEPAAALAEALAERPTLLVLDTFEHVPAAAAAVAGLPAAAPTLRIVTASRAPFAGAGGRAFRLEPLPAASAVELLVERVKDVRPDFEVTAANSDGVSELVSRLEGLPLAIELAAPLLRLMPAPALAARVAHPLPLLESTRSGVPPRQRTMRSALASSYDLLGEAEQSLFRRLAVFAGPFDAAAAERVAGGGGDAFATLRSIAGLVDHNLLAAAGSDDDVEPSFAFSGLVRTYALELLSQSGELDSAFARSADFVIELARTVTFGDPQSQSCENLERVKTALPNIEAVFDWTLATGRIELGMRLAQALWAFWWLTGSFASGLARVMPLIAAAQAGAPVGEAVLAEVYLLAAGLTDARGEIEEADALARQALPIKRRLGDKLSEAAILTGQGVHASERCDFVQARALFEAGLAIRQACERPLLVAKSLTDLGQSAFHEGDVVAAAAYLERALAAFREVRSDLGTGIAFALLGAIAANQRATDRAETFSKEALRVGNAVGHGATVAVATFNLGLVALQRHDLDAAEGFLREALAAFHAGEASGEVPYVVEALAEVAAAKGNPREAVRLFGAAAAFRERARKRLFPVFRESRDAVIATLRAALGNDVFEAEWMVGTTQRLTPPFDKLPSTS